MRDDDIEVRAARWAWHAGLMVAMLAVLMVVAWWTRPSVARPLEPGEFKAVVAEIDAMARTPDDQVAGFKVREATPDRIERLYRNAELAGLSKSQRENGLVFAGRGPLLQFDKPSDVVRAIDRWFPQEMATARREQQLHTGHVHLHGPFANWEDEPAAFLALWHCMPQRAWLQPDRSPFDPEADRGNGYQGLVARSSDETDFGRCVRERSGWETSFSRSPQDSFAVARRQTAERSAPLLAARFARHLAQRGCIGTGPDDCALVALLWSSLAPGDPALAEALKKIAPDVLAPAKTAAPDSEAGRRQRLINGLRQAALLRAQLTSIAAAPAAWTAEALPQALRQLAALQVEQGRAMWDPQRSWSRFEFHGGNDTINPWPLLDTLAKQPAGLAALRAQITALPLSIYGDCQAHDPWLRRMPQGVLAGLALETWQAGRPSPCVQPDWNWLRGSDITPDARAMLAKLVTLLKDAPGQVHEQVLSGLTNEGADCFEEGLRHAVDELQLICRTWISEPAKVEEPLPHIGQPVQPADRFAALSLPDTPEDLLQPRPASQARRADWLVARLASLGAPEGRTRALLADAQRAGRQVTGLRGWRRGDGRQQLVELALTQLEPAEGQAPAVAAFPFGGQRVLMLIGAGQARVVGVAPRFGFQYDEGDIAQVTDIDHDGRPEVWLSGEFGECDGEDPKPGVDCAITELHLGEVWGDTLSHFAWSPSPGAVKESRP